MCRISLALWCLITVAVVKVALCEGTMTRTDAPAPLASSQQHQDQDVNDMHDDWSKGCTVVGNYPCNPNRGMSLNADQTWHNTKLKHIDTPVPMEASATPANFTSQTSITNACHLRKQMAVLPVDDIKTVYWPQAELHLAKIVNANITDAIGIARKLQQNGVTQQHVHQTWQITKLHRKHRFWHCLRLQTAIPRNISRMDQHCYHHRCGKQPWRIHEGPLDA